LLIAFLILLSGVAALVFAEDSAAGIPLLLVPPVLRKRKLLRSRTPSRAQASSIATRYLENPGDPDTKLYVEQELSYTRTILTHCQADRSLRVLSQLLEIGTVELADGWQMIIFIPRREGDRTTILMCAKA